MIRTLEPEQSKGALVERYLKRKAEVTEEDHRKFQDYLEQKARQVAPADDRPPEKPSLVNRRNLLKVVAGTAVAAEPPSLPLRAVFGRTFAESAVEFGLTAQDHALFAARAPPLA